MLRLLLFLVGISVLIIPEFLKVYYIMPFPGSQEADTIDTAYMLHNNIMWFRLLGLAIIAWPAWKFIQTRKIWVIWPTVVAIGVWLFILYVTNFVMLADKMFIQPKVKNVVEVGMNKVPSANLVVGVTVNGESKAYPIEIIGYHHQVRDSVGGEPVMVTYCTVCRTGRVYSPIVDGQPETFRLVGMDHFNAMFEDSRTRSWWRQVNGEAITGKMKGKKLEEIPSEQMSLAAWTLFHPDTKILQPDTAFQSQYDSLGLYDEGKLKGILENTDTIPWSKKSWVIGVQSGNDAKAYDWIETLRTHVVNDKVGETPVVVAIENDNASFHVWKRPDSLTFSYESNALKDNTGSTWNWQGQCIDGPLKDRRLEFQQSYQEYYHSWKTFHPNTKEYHE
ncbi:MAG TPA: DUF3179 domain-containing (seleno)protein [Cyclobacteriaceae bacterium]|nr:DUF3179 domain-containing (seleno)protein [Cyclobacteriaceae bacterium]